MYQGVHYSMYQKQTHLYAPFHAQKAVCRLVDCPKQTWNSGTNTPSLFPFANLFVRMRATWQRGSLVTRQKFFARLPSTRLSSAQRFPAVKHIFRGKIRFVGRFTAFTSCLLIHRLINSDTFNNGWLLHKHLYRVSKKRWRSRWIFKVLCCALSLFSGARKYMVLRTVNRCGLRPQKWTKKNSIRLTLQNPLRWRVMLAQLSLIR